MKMTDKIKCLWFFFWGNVFAFFMYDRQYLNGKYFRGKRTGMLSIGWRWVYFSSLSRLFTGKNKGSAFPIGSRTTVVIPENITFHRDDINNFQSPGTYYQAIGKINIGKGTYIAPNVGIITSNHNLHSLDDHMPAKPVNIGKKCWIGMNSVILPGVELGENTIVGAGSVVTKSFSDGHCVIAGSPAKIIKNI